MRERRLEMWLRAKNLAEAAAAQNRGFTPQELDLWDDLNREMEVLDRRIAAIINAENRLKLNELQPRITYNRRLPPARAPAGCWQLV